MEPGLAQRRRLWRRRATRAWLWRSYQDIRHRVSGRARFARRYFAAAPVSSAPSGSSVDTTPREVVDWVNSAGAHRFVAGVAPDIAIVCGTSIIAPTLLAGVPIAINVHGGHLPDYKGNHGVFFAYAAGDFVHIGASLHLVTSELDGGDLLAAVRTQPEPTDHDGHVYCRAVRAAIDTLVEMLAGVADGGTLHTTPQPRRGRTFRHRDRTPAIELRTWWRRKTGRR